MDQLKAFSKLLRLGFEWLKSNLNLVIILPTVLGGLWQIIELSNISFSFIRFFSVTQVIPDGLLILLILLIFGASGGFVYGIWYILQNQNDKNATEATSKQPDVVKPQLPTKRSGLYYGLILMTFYVCFLVLTVYAANYFSKDIDSLFGLVKIVPVIMITMFFAMGCYIFGNVYLHQIKILSSICQLSGWLMLFVMGICGIIFISQFHVTFTLPSNMANIEAVKQKMEMENPDMNLEIVYMNDKYIFVRLHGLIKVAGKPKQEVIKVYTFEDLVKTDLKGYTFPEDPGSLESTDVD